MSERPRRVPSLFGTALITALLLGVAVALAWKAVTP